MPDVKRPGAASDPAATDLLAPVATFLRGIALLPAEAEAKPGEHSKLAIEDFSLAITRSTQNLIKWGSGAGAGVGIVGAVGGYFGSASDTVVSAAVLSTGIVLAAGLWALARVMDGDVRGRAATATAVVEARAVVAKVLLDSFNASSGGTAQRSGTTTTAPKASGPSETQVLLCLARYGDKMSVRTTAGTTQVTGLRWTTEDGLELHLTSGDYVQTSKVTAFEAER